MNGSIGAQYDVIQRNKFLIQKAWSQDKYKEEQKKCHIFQAILHREYKLLIK